MKNFMLRNVIFVLLFTLMFSSGLASALERLSEDELGQITGQDGATFIFDEFDFYITSPGIEYLDVHFDEIDDIDGDSTIAEIQDAYPLKVPILKSDAYRSSILLDDFVISDGNNGPVIMSGMLDFDGFSKTIDGVDYTFGKLDLREPDLTMDLDVSNIAIRPAQVGATVYDTLNLGGLAIEGLDIDAASFYFGAASNNTGLAAELNLRLSIESLDIDAIDVLHGTSDDEHIVFKNIMIAGSFLPKTQDLTSDLDTVINDRHTPGNQHYIIHKLEQDYDRSLPVAYAADGETPGLWSEQRAWEYSGLEKEYNDGVTEYDPQKVAYYFSLINAHRYKPNWKNWEFSEIAQGTLKIGDAENGNPMRMDFTVDDQEYIPFPYDIICGEYAVDNRAEWYEPVSLDFNVDARGWKDGKDNYIQDGLNYQPVKNPRFNKAYISLDAHISGSLRLVSDNEDSLNGYRSDYGYTDVMMIEGIDLQVHSEIPGYGYGNTPNSIPRPYPNPNFTGPRYDAPFGSGGWGNEPDTFWPEESYSPSYPY